MAKVGALLFYWSWLEQQLTRAVREARERLDLEPSPVRGGLAERLELWVGLASQLPENFGQMEVASEVRAQCLELRDIRNLIVHGLLAGDANRRDSAPHIICAEGGYEEPDGLRRCYTLDDLEHVNQAIDACRRSFINLAYFNYRIGSGEVGRVQPPPPRQTSRRAAQ